MPSGEPIADEKDPEWGSWLNEYRKMKEAKEQADKTESDKEPMSDTERKVSSLSAPASMSGSPRLSSSDAEPMPSLKGGLSGSLRLSLSRDLESPGKRKPLGPLGQKVESWWNAVKTTLTPESPRKTSSGSVSAKSEPSDEANQPSPSYSQTETPLLSPISPSSDSATSPRRRHPNLSLKISSSNLRNPSMMNRTMSQQPASKPDDSQKPAETPATQYSWNDSPLRSGTNTQMSLQNVKKQIKQKVLLAKKDCDMGMRKVINAMNTYIESVLMECIEDQGRRPRLEDVEDEGSEAEVEERVNSMDRDRPRRTREPSASQQTARRGRTSLARSSSRSRSPNPAVLKEFINAAATPSPAKKGALPATAKLPHTKNTLPRIEARLNLLTEVSSLPEYFIQTLRNLAEIAVTVLDAPLSYFISEPGAVLTYVNQVQALGEVWEEHPNTPCRHLYVNLLLAVAGISRLLEWWQAEKGFWNFDQEEDLMEDSFGTISDSNRDDRFNFVVRRGDDDDGDEESALDVRDERESIPSYAPQHTKQAASISSQNEVSTTVLLELDIKDHRCVYISPGWQELTGSSPDEVLNQRFTDFVADADLFEDAVRGLREDDAHLVDMRFHIETYLPSDNATQTSPDEIEPVYLEMVGKGMLMHDAISGEPTMTMWAIHRAPPSSHDASYEELPSDDEAEIRTGGDAMARTHSQVTVLDRSSHLEVPPYDADISSKTITPMGSTPEPGTPTLVMCNICEHEYPAWFFEKHSEMCGIVHRLETQIRICDDELEEHLRLINEMLDTIDKSDTAVALDYRGMIIATPPPLHTPPTALENLKPPLSPKPQFPTTRKSIIKVLNDLVNILEIASDVSMPEIPVDTDQVPIEQQRLNSPDSENCLRQAREWMPPIVQDPALKSLVEQTTKYVKEKVDSINRLRHTIVYSEKVRLEWSEQLTTKFETPPASRPMSRAKRAMPVRQRLFEAEMIPTPVTSPRVGHRHGSFQMANRRLSRAEIGSPLLPSISQARAGPPSIKDFEIIKPISKGAFGSVYLSKKRTTGGLFAVKVLKKSDMIAKNQVTNVKAERMILMTQTNSPFVVRLFFTFQSKFYLYLVMEYLPGGDLAALVKMMGPLSEEWTRIYMAEVVNGLEYLHGKGIIHRDIKPDNMLIDQHGHIKLTDFGLSRIGLLGRQARDAGVTSVSPWYGSEQSYSSTPGLHSAMSVFSNSSSANAVPVLSSLTNPITASNLRRVQGSQTASHHPFAASTSSPMGTPDPQNQSQPSSYFSMVASNRATDNRRDSQSSAFEGVLPSDLSTFGSDKSYPGTPRSGSMNSSSPAIAPQQPTNVVQTSDSTRRFVGTPDYLAPESIIGSGQDDMVDWWALGCVTYELLYGIPPFHADTPEKVFDNILSLRIVYPPEIACSEEARHFMQRLITREPRQRLGMDGAGEVKSHPFFYGIDWEHLMQSDAPFVPVMEDASSTDYFDARGATHFEPDAEDKAVIGDMKKPVAPDVASPRSSMTSTGKRSTSGPSSLSSSGILRNPRVTEVLSDRRSMLDGDSSPVRGSSQMTSAVMSTSSGEESPSRSGHGTPVLDNPVISSADASENNSEAEEERRSSVGSSNTPSPRQRRKSRRHRASVVGRMRAMSGASDQSMTSEDDSRAAMSGADDDAAISAPEQDEPDFGNFTYANTEALESANAEVIKKLKSDNLLPTPIPRRLRTQSMSGDAENDDKAARRLSRG